MTIDPAIALSFSLGLAALLAAAAAHKISHPVQFFAIVADYRIAPTMFAPVIGAAAIAIECAIALGLLVPATRSAAASACGALLLVYAAAIALNILRGRTVIDCGCSFGAARESDRLTPWLLVRNGVLAVASFSAAMPSAPRTLGLVDALSIAIFVAGAGVLYAAFDVLSSRMTRSV